MQDAVHGQQREFLAQRVAGSGGLIGSEFRAQHDVAEHRRPRFGRVWAATRFELVHRKAHHVGRAGQIHPAHVQVGHRRGVEQHHRKLGRRIHFHLANDEPCDADQFLF